MARTFAIRLPPTRQAPGAARHSLGAELTRWGACSEDVDVAKIVVTELVGNSVIHSECADDVEVCAEWRDQRLRIEVTDAGAKDPPELPGRFAGTDAASGRGLQIVDALTEDWGASASPGVMTVWAVIATTAHARDCDSC
jgi:anti-sigma regulatory factor (Ser/Thr protein kinase)